MLILCYHIRGYFSILVSCICSSIVIIKRPHHFPPLSADFIHCYWCHLIEYFTDQQTLVCHYLSVHELQSSGQCITVMNCSLNLNFVVVVADRTSQVKGYYISGSLERTNMSYPQGDEELSGCGLMNVASALAKNRIDGDEEHNPGISCCFPSHSTFVFNGIAK